MLIWRVLFLEQVVVPLGHASPKEADITFECNHLIARVFRNEPPQWWEGARSYGLGKKTEDAKHGKTAIVYLNLTATKLNIV
jgi:hypothetical protein